MPLEKAWSEAAFCLSLIAAEECYILRAIISPFLDGYPRVSLLNYLLSFNFDHQFGLQPFRAPIKGVYGTPNPQDFFLISSMITIRSRLGAVLHLLSDAKTAASSARKVQP